MEHQCCNKYSFSDLTVGMTESFQVLVSEEKQNAFTEMSGDINPMHLDRQFAVERGYTDRLVYGMCTASFYSTLVGVYLPGEHCLFRECNVQWPKPVYIGDELTVTGIIIALDDRINCATIKAEIRNQNGEKVSRAKLIVGVLGE